MTQLKIVQELSFMDYLVHSLAYVEEVHDEDYLFEHLSRIDKVRHGLYLAGVCHIEY